MQEFYRASSVCKYQTQRIMGSLIWVLKEGRFCTLCGLGDLLWPGHLTQNTTLARTHTHARTPVVCVYSAGVCVWQLAKQAWFSAAAHTHTRVSYTQWSVHGDSGRVYFSNRAWQASYFTSVFCNRRFTRSSLKFQHQETHRDETLDVTSFRYAWYM